MDLNKEIIRYLGYGQNTPDEHVMALIQECRQSVRDVAEPKSIYRRFDVRVEGDEITCAGITMKSSNLAKNLRGCHEVIFFAATLGSGVDRLLNRCERLEISRAVVVQAVAAAVIEEYIDECQQKIIDMLAEEKLFVRPRFSPGYGDLPLTIQSDFLRILNTAKTIGITLSDGNIMLPEKSVTAIMGISREDSHCLISGCELCDKSECEYRR